MRPAGMTSVTVAAALIFALLFSPVFADTKSADGTKREPKKIDFNDVVESNPARPERADGPALKIAVAAMISPKYTHKYYIELLNLIGERLGRRVVFVQKKTYAEVNELLKQKKLDMAFVCSGPYASGKDEFGMEIVAVPVCHGEKVYYSYFIASRNSGIDSLDGLRGKTFAFTDPLSNTGYLVPTYYLARRNETSESFFKETFFTHSHDNSIQAVAEGLADGAAVDSLIYDFMRTENPGLTEKTVVIEKSPPYAIPPVVVSSSIAPEIKQRMKDLFLGIHEDPDGGTILKKLQIERFVEGNDEDYETVRELESFLRSKRR